MKRQKWWILSAVGLLAIIGAAGFLREDVLTVRTGPPTDRILRAVRTEEGQTIRLRYRHSVERSIVEGFFRVGAGPAFYIIETRMASTGTGLPNTAAGRSRRDGQWIVVDEEGRMIKRIPFYLSRVNETQLFAAGRKVNLDDLRDGSRLRIGVERIRRMRLWLWQMAGIEWRLPTNFEEN